MQVLVSFYICSSVEGVDEWMEEIFDFVDCSVESKLREPALPKKVDQ